MTTPTGSQNRYLTHREQLHWFLRGVLQVLEGGAVSAKCGMVLEVLPDWMVDDEAFEKRLRDDIGVVPVGQGDDYVLGAINWLRQDAQRLTLAEALAKANATLKLGGHPAEAFMVLEKAYLECLHVFQPASVRPDGHD